MEKTEKKIVVFYYSQTRQMLDIMRSIMDVPSLSNAVYKEIVPEQTFPFPWSRGNFFEVFPECRLGDPPFGIKDIDLSDVQDADLVIVGGQTWFLSPSLPIQSFFLSPKIKEYLNGKSVIFVNGCRNMWLMTFRKVRQYIGEAGAHFVGHIVLQDRAPNLVSVLTIIRWLFYGGRDACFGLPRAGVSYEDIRRAYLFGMMISATLKTDNLPILQKQLVENLDAIQYKPGVAYLEKMGHRIFGLWAKFIRRKGGYGDPKRARRVQMFVYYLIFILFVVSPFGVLFFYLTYPIRAFFIGRQKRDACYNLSWNEKDKIQ